MTKKKNIAVKILAILALFGIIISVIGTAIIVITGNSQAPYSEVDPTDFSDLIDTDNVQITTGSGEVITGTGITVVSTESVTATGVVAE